MPIPILPPAPGLFSTTAVPPRASPRWVARMRAMMSVGPAGANGTMILIGCSGYPAAFAGRGARLEAATAEISVPPARRSSRRDRRLDSLAPMRFTPHLSHAHHRPPAAPATPPPAPPPPHPAPPAPPLPHQPF